MWILTSSRPASEGDAPVVLYGGAAGVFGGDGAVVVVGGTSGDASS